jgi:hypothetical protein
MIRFSGPRLELAVLAAGVFDTADPPETEFSVGLERILDGIEALICATR